MLHISFDWYSKMLKDLVKLEASIDSEVITQRTKCGGLIQYLSG
jgi:hypothetical protein